MTPTTTTGPITLADVRAALADTDPNTTNAAKLQKIIGRGSLATVQKHLEGIRAELAPVPPVAPGAAPAAPADAIAVIWGAAWAQAQAMTLGRLEAVTAEREALAALTKTQTADLAALAGEVDAGAETVAAALADLKKAEAKNAELEGHLAHLAGELSKRNEDVAQAQAEAETAAELAKRDAQIERQALQSTIDRLTDQASELKSLLARLTPAQPVQP